MTVAPLGTSAWRRLDGGISRPREVNMELIRSTNFSSRSSGTFITSAIASRVMSSWVGPSPPHTMMPSLRANAVRKASTMRWWLSPTAWWKCEPMPAAARCSPNHAELVSAIWPSNSSVPTATISILMSGSDLVSRIARVTVNCRRLAAVEVVLTSSEHRENRRHPDRHHQHRMVLAQRGDQAQGDGHALEERLHLGGRSGRDRHALSSYHRSVDGESPSTDRWSDERACRSRPERPPR